MRPVFSTQLPFVRGKDQRSDTSDTLVRALTKIAAG